MKPKTQKTIKQETTERTAKATTEDIIQVMCEEAERHARIMQERLGETVAALRDGNHLGAFGALSGMDEEFRDLSSLLKLGAMLTVRNTIESADLAMKASKRIADPRPQRAATHAKKQRKKRKGKAREAEA
jgi:hypothetical protein